MNPKCDGILERSVRALAAVLLFTASAALAQDVGKPMILVASPDMYGTFAGTVLLAVPKGDLHVGFILNRATDRKVASALREYPASAKIVDPVYFGGSDAPAAIFALAQRDPGPGAARLFGEVFMTANPKALERLVAQRPQDARFFAGSVSWRADELAAEIADGLWYVAKPSESLVFAKDTSGLYDHLLARLGQGRLPPKGLRKTTAGLAN